MAFSSTGRFFMSPHYGRKELFFQTHYRRNGFLFDPIHQNRVLFLTPFPGKCFLFKPIPSDVVLFSYPFGVFSHPIPSKWFFLWPQSATTGFLYLPTWFFISPHSRCDSFCCSPIFELMVFYETPFLQNGLFSHPKWFLLFTPFRLDQMFKNRAKCPVRVLSVCACVCVCECEFVTLRLRLARRLSASLVCLRVYPFCRYFC